MRVIPVLLLHGSGLVKTVRFRNPTYLGDPINAIRIFNDKLVDEIVVLDVLATREGRPVDVPRVSELAGECFMPLAFGGGIRSVEDVRRVLRAGAEKVVINTALETSPDIVREAARVFGSQSIVASIDVRDGLFRRQQVFTRAGTGRTGRTPVEAAQRAVELGAGEIILNSASRDGTMAGYDLELVKSVSAAVDVPVVALGGAGCIEDFAAAASVGAAAVAAGSFFVYQGRHRAVLISFPDQVTLQRSLFEVLD